MSEPSSTEPLTLESPADKSLHDSPMVVEMDVDNVKPCKIQRTTPVATTWCPPLQEAKDRRRLITFFLGKNCRDGAKYEIPMSTIQTYTDVFDHSFSTSLMPMPIDLMRDSPSVFGHIKHYFEHHNWFNFPPALQHLPEGPAIPFEEIVSIYLFAFHREMPAIQNAAIDLFANRVKYSQELPDRQTIYRIWSATPPGSALRCLLVDLVRAMWIPEYHRHALWGALVGGKSDNWMDLMHFIDALGNEGKRIRVSDRMWRRVLGCDWHVHAPGEWCDYSEEMRLGEEGPGDGEVVLGPVPVMGELIRSTVG
ncbi:unnamed protein product [Zymoseptoria tritici ST99CH_1A5]|uniref:BTB domain-containing protein n=2 Tax=Zymoseptoria tritici TaxID=1047171 RepID=A0A2H1G4T1_ZYMTR|nr:unnamed protein product [Zymoseptoria tritici ST99CH_1E4]SMR49741.1 unnamed protein product [Zymoseptoria tritici ST99CH_3D1]SMY22439.1 unnamed protein product [Zymoseptoria tritici ST99CH_1A5]